MPARVTDHVSRSDAGESTPVSGSPNWLMIIIGIILVITGIVSIVKGATSHP